MQECLECQLGKEAAQGQSPLQQDDKNVFQNAGKNVDAGVDDEDDR